MRTESLLPEHDAELPLGPQSRVLRDFGLPYADELLAQIAEIERAAPFRHMTTRGGYRMSVGLTNCGDLGWYSDRGGYRYTRTDPLSGQPWPDMPEIFLSLAQRAAGVAGFPDFVPDACLVNRYQLGARMSLHQDRNERDFSAPIVSVSLGMSAVFLFGGEERSASANRVTLHHGDVVVWGGIDRLRYHGILPLKGPAHPVLGEARINLTFRKAG